MQKNKYQIGQIVIVIAGRKIVEKQVLQINGSRKEISYELGDARQGNIASFYIDNLIDLTRDYAPLPLSIGCDYSHKGGDKSSRIVYRGAINPSVVMVDDIDSNTYLESEIFETEEDFRKSVTIEKFVVVKTKADLIQELKDKVGTEITGDEVDKLLTEITKKY